MIQRARPVRAAAARQQASRRLPGRESDDRAIFGENGRPFSDSDPRVALNRSGRRGRDSQNCRQRQGQLALVCPRTVVKLRSQRLAWSVHGPVRKPKRRDSPTTTRVDGARHGTRWHGSVRTSPTKSAAGTIPKEQSPWPSSTVTPERSVSVCGRRTTCAIAAWRPTAGRAIGRRRSALGDSIRTFQCGAFHGFVAAQRNMAIVAFRGTVSIGNALTDIETALIRHDIFPGLIHLGFAHALGRRLSDGPRPADRLGSHVCRSGHGPQPRRGHGLAGLAPPGRSKVFRSAPSIPTARLGPAIAISATPITCPTTAS